MTSLKRWAVLAGLVLWTPTLAWAQASITGTVRDTSGGILPGVTVEAASPALIERVRSVVTDGTGQFRIVDLRPGTYSVTFTLPGFSTVKRDGLELAGSFTATVNAEMRVGALEETITVTGESPTVDVQTVTQQQVLRKEVIEAIPSSRTHFSIANLIAGVQTNNRSDVGGSNAISHVFLTAHGGRTTDQRVTLDGLSTQNAEGAGQYSGYMPNMSAAQELTVDFAAGAAEQPTGGVRVNIIPREGGNRMSGVFFASGMGERFQSSNFDEDLRSRGLPAPNRIQKIWDVNPGAGGPIVRDRVWWYGAARWNGENIYGGGFENLNAGDPTKWTYEADLSKPTRNDAKQRSANVRLTFQANEKNKISVFYDDQSRCWCPRNLTPTTSPEAVTSNRYPYARMASVTWSSPFTNRVLLDVGFSYRPERWQYPRHDTATIGVVEQSTGRQYRGQIQNNSGGLFPNTRNQVRGVRAALSYVTGAHAVKAGFSDYASERDVALTDNDYNLSYRFNNGVPNQLTERTTPFTISDRLKADLGVFVQDKWTMDRLTLNLGLRYDYFNNYFPEQTLGPSQYVPNRNITFPKTPWVAWHDVTPRLGASYDLFGDGKTALKFGLNKYMLAFGLQGDFGNSANPITRTANSVTRSWNDANHDFVPDCDLTNPLANGECGVMSNVNFGSPIPSTTVDTDILRGWGVRAYNWELMASVQHEVVPNVAVDFGYFRRTYGNFSVTDNRAVAASDFGSFSVAAPSNPGLPDGGGYVVSGLYNVNPNKAGQVDNFFTASDNFGDQTERWQGVDIGVNARPGTGVLLQAGLSTGRTLTDNCEIRQALPEIAPTDPYCRTQTAFLTQFKGFGSYTLPRIDVQLAATFQSTPGPAIAANYVASNAVVAASLGRPLSGGSSNVTVNLVEPGTMYGDRVNQLDLRFGKILRMGQSRTSINVELFNALNANPVLSQNDNYASWQRPLSILQARIVKFGVQFDF